MPRLSILVAVLGLATSPLVAQEHHDHGSSEQLGRVVFPTSCASAVQPRFERAMTLLHSFWWEATLDAFTEIAQADPTCAMAQWGLALAHWENPFAGGPTGPKLEAGARAADRAGALTAPTARERGFIGAVAALYRNYATTPNASRLQAYSDAMAEAYEPHRGDSETAIFYAISLVATASPTDTTFSRQRRANDIVAPLFRDQPDHPGLAHYIIHANDSPALAQYGLEAARAYARIAPAVPHAQHMPSHIFIRLGLWDDNIAANRRSYEAGLAYAKEHFPGAYGAHEFHAMDYMVYGYVQRGRDREARSVAAEALGVHDVRPPAQIVSEYAIAAMPARVALERDDWESAAVLMVTATHPVGQLVTRFARGLGLARNGDAIGARAEAEALEQLARALAGPGYGWANIASLKRQAVMAWVALERGDTARALADARAAADGEDRMEKHPVTPGEVLPARELYGDVLLAVGKPREALVAYETTLTREPNRARAYLGAARAALAAGDRTAARDWAKRYLDVIEGGDGDRPALAQMQSLARR